MIYLIGGPGRVGKTSLAKKVQVAKGIPFLPTDMVFDSLVNAAPGLGMDRKFGDFERVEKFAPFLKELIKSAHGLHPEMGDYLIEGVDILPKVISEIKEIPIRAIFLGFSEISLKELLDTGGGCKLFKRINQ